MAEAMSSVVGRLLSVEAEEVAVLALGILSGRNGDDGSQAKVNESQETTIHITKRRIMDSFLPRSLQVSPSTSLEWDNNTLIVLSGIWYLK